MSYERGEHELYVFILNLFNTYMIEFYIWMTIFEVHGPRAAHVPGTWLQISLMFVVYN